MAKANPESVSSKWRRLFEANPKLLKSAKNEEAIRLFEEANPGEVLDEKKLGVMANVKSKMRKKLKIAGRARRPAPTTPAAPVKAARVMVQPTISRTAEALDALEEAIDRALTLAKNVGEDSLDDVVKLLRRARNKVIILAGV